MAIAACVAAATPARAAPNLPLDEPDWIVLRDAQARGLRPDLLGGVHLIGEDEVGQGGWPDGFWVRPVERVVLRGVALGEHLRPYSLPARPRNLGGDVGFSCEFQEGRPCGGGLGLATEVDASAGFGRVLSATVRARLDLGNHGYAALAALDRASFKAQLGAVSLEAGRDVLALGPSFRGGLLWSRHAAPLDQLRVRLRPVALPFLDGDALRVSLLYFIGRLRQPVGRDGALVDGTRFQFDLFNRVQLGASRLLLFGGDGAPDVSFSDFVVEHLHARYPGGVPLGDNRVSADVAVSAPELWGARAYLEIAFEDFRRKFLNVLQIDTDYLAGLELRALPAGPLRRVFVEAATTGQVSEESPEWLTGFGGAGRPFGTPLGPTAQSVYLRGEFELPRARVSPWAEVLRFRNDTYVRNNDGAGGSRLDRVGTAERRGRLGLDVALPVSPSLSLDVTAFAERVWNSELVAGATRWNGGIVTAIRYAPRF
ncbi:MAG: hypothetical protein NVSMB23_28950 [Myxococcales bacterium]